MTELEAFAQLAGQYNILYIDRMSDPRPIDFRGSSLDDLRAFPLAARREAGHQLDQVQHGQEPDDWKPMNTVGQGVGYGTPPARSASCTWRS